jgi:hypothetical protein
VKPFNDERIFVTRPDGTSRWITKHPVDLIKTRKPKPISVFTFWNELPPMNDGAEIVCDWCEPLDPIYRVQR